MFNPLWHNVKITGIQDNVAIPKLNCDLPEQDQKEIIGFGMRMPDKFTVYFDDHHVVTVKPGHDFGRPKILKFSQFGCEVDRGHADSPPAKSGMSSAAKP